MIRPGAAASSLGGTVSASPVTVASAAPSETRACVRMPAGLSAISRFSPRMPPSSADSANRRASDQLSAGTLITSIQRDGARGVPGRTNGTLPGSNGKTIRGVPMHRLMLLIGTAAVIALAVLTAPRPHAQSFNAPAGSVPAPDPNVPLYFEAASIKPSNPSAPPGMGIRRQPGGRFNTLNTPVRLLVTFAY